MPCYARSVKGEDDARERIQKLLVTGDNRLKQGVDPEKARESWEQALDGRPRGGPRGRRSGRSSRSGSPTCRRRPAEDRLDPLGLPPHVVLRGRRARGLVRARQRRRLGEAPRASASTSSGSTRTPASGGTNSGGPPMRVATTERPRGHPLEQRLPERLDQARLAERRGSSASRRGTSSCGTRPTSADAVAALELRAQRPVADEGQRALAELRERVGEADDVLALLERADAEEARRAVGRRRDGEPLEVDARSTRPPSCRAPRAASSRARAADTPRRRRPSPRGARRAASPRRCRAARRCCARRARARSRRAARASASAAIRPARDEEVRVDDVGPSRARSVARASSR